VNRFVVIGGEFLLLALVVAAIAVVIGLYGVGSQRTQALRRRWGAFTCDVMIAGAASPGIAQFSTDSLQWWRRRSLASRPSRCWQRHDIEVIERSALGLGQDVTVVLAHRGATVELVMSAGAYSGLTSWLEATPAVLTGVN